MKEPRRLALIGLASASLRQPGQARRRLPRRQGTHPRWRHRTRSARAATGSRISGAAGWFQRQSESCAPTRGRSRPRRASPVAREGAAAGRLARGTARLLARHMQGNERTKPSVVKSLPRRCAQHGPGRRAVPVQSRFPGHSQRPQLLCTEDKRPFELRVPADRAARRPCSQSTRAVR